jgi:hypothetical protein
MQFSASPTKKLVVLQFVKLLTTKDDQKNIIQMKDVFNCLFSGLLVAVDVPVSP